MAAAALCLLMTSCKKNKDDAPAAPTVVKQWTVPLSAKNEVPAPAGRNETGTALLQLLSDNTFTYTVTVNGLAAGDALTNAHIHTGDVINSGPVILGFNPTFSGNTASGTVTGLRTSFIDSLKNDAVDLYVNAHSTQAPAGIVRGQLNKTIELAMDVVMTGNNEVPAVATTASGLAMLRLTSDKKLYAKVTVTGLEAGDTWTAAHIHKAAAGANSGVFIGFYSSAAEFGTTKIIPVDDAMFASLKTDAMYVNAHSTNHASGTIRGQIR
ncbi:MAG: hypothetical protein JWP27_1447 [Flaviaesturariibacter sp.]|nr:hypothetical protein [Flaviaesturariibacter sp.]